MWLGYYFYYWIFFLAAAAKTLQSCLTLCNPIDSSPAGSPVPGILQARILEWVAISLSNAWRWKEEVKSLSRAPLGATPWTAAYQAPLSMGFSRHEYWSRVPLPYYSAKYLRLQSNWLELQVMATWTVCYLCLCQPLSYCWLFNSSWGFQVQGYLSLP